MLNKFIDYYIFITLLCIRAYKNKVRFSSVVKIVQFCKFKTCLIKMDNSFCLRSKIIETLIIFKNNRNYS